MLADTEALDSYFAEKYTSGDTSAFLVICSGSVTATDSHLDGHRQEYPDAEFHATSFLELFGDELLEREAEYAKRLSTIHNLGKLARVDVDVERRSGLYNQMYGSSVDRQFLVNRMIRTMGQYLALGELIGRDPQSCIIVHDTVNASLFQDINRFAGDNPPKDQLPICPVIQRDVRVYS